MTDLIVVPQTNQWHKLKALVLDSVSYQITRRVYNLGLMLNHVQARPWFHESSDYGRWIAHNRFTLPGQNPTLRPGEQGRSGR